MLFKGQISKEEFRNVCNLINQHDPTAKLNDSAIDDLANTMDIDKDGFINFNEVREYIFIFWLIIYTLKLIYTSSFWKHSDWSQIKLISEENKLQKKMYK